ncbi:uncharacterized protein, partial [Rutidosis leptorrhynchoides]|uniref:uncharacterized protein n=1 Tax=Rutidosis leptorrhynchoides TaxID=125765 RepID=UPI003A99F367
AGPRPVSGGIKEFEKIGIGIEHSYELVTKIEECGQFSSIIEEIVNLFKTAIFSHDEGRCLDALTQLKKLPVTCELLLKTKVAKRLRVLRKHSNKKICDSASDSSILGRQESFFTRGGGKRIQEKTVRRMIVRYERHLPKSDDEFCDEMRKRLYDCLYKVADETDIGVERREVNSCDPARVAVLVETCLFHNWRRRIQET